MNNKRWLIGLLSLALFLGGFAQPQASVYADCLGPNPTATAQPTYLGNFLAVDPSHLVALWVLAETGGTTAADSSGNAHSGTYSGPTLNATTFTDGSPAPSFDGVNDFVNVYSSGLASAFNANEGTLFLWGKVSGAGIWTDATSRFLATFRADANNRVVIQRTTTNNTLALLYQAGGTSKQISSTALGGNTGYFSAAITWSKSADQVIAYTNGTQTGSTLTGLGTWVGSLASGNTGIGANGIGLGSPWSGNLSYVALYSAAESSGNISTLNTVPSVSPTATLYPTCTPSPTLTPTITPSMSPTMTLTPSQTPSPTATLDLYSYVTVIPPGGGLSDAARGAMKYEVTIGQIMIALVLFAILIIGVFDLIIKSRGY